ncbi:hypothetical protein [Shivajiella indica]|uniref:Uncharacterized protein n=1 Tax=Shivajiella indica TaxID=872115 RepID=A0ABW5B9J9_9BACT
MCRNDSETYRGETKGLSDLEMVGMEEHGWLKVKDEEQRQKW